MPVTAQCYIITTEYINLPRQSTVGPTPHTVMRNLRHHRLNASIPVPRWQKAAVSLTVSAANPDT